MAFNTYSEIKPLLLLESENQTLEDSEITTYISDANRELYDEIQKSFEIDVFHSKEDGTVDFFPVYRIETIKKVKVNGEEISSSEYDISEDSDYISIENIKFNDKVEIRYIPTNYKLAERAICMVNMLTRLNPFSGENINPTYAEWREKKKELLSKLKGKIGTGVFAG